jgi:uncharacterized protein YegL
MTQPIALIKESEPVKRIAVLPGNSRKPFVAVVYATRDGDLEVLDGGKPMGWGDQMLSRYRTRYEVDISDHHLTFEFKDDLPLPTQADLYHFHASVSVSFRVTDPAEVIRRNVLDAVPLVRGHLLGVCRPITRMFAIEEAEQAEAAIRARFRRDTLIQGGISLYAVEVRLSLDEKGRQYLQDIEQAERDDKVHAARHVTDVNDVEREGRLDLLKQARDHMLQERERLMLNGQPLDAISMVQLHLQRNPHDTEGAMKMMAALEQARFEHEQTQTDRMQQLLGAFAKDGLVNPAEVATLVEAVVKHMEGSAGAIQATATAGAPVSRTVTPRPALDWNESLDDILGPETVTNAGTGNAPPPAAGSRPANIAPVYLLVDESPGTWPDGLDLVVRDLMKDLAARPRVAAAVPLGVLGFAGTVESRVPLGVVPAKPELPGFTVREPADHAALFAYLRDNVPDDLGVLRARHPSVRPPLFVMLCTGDPRDDGWESWHRRLLSQVRRADAIVLGMGAATAAIAGFASHPELAFLAPGPDADRAIGLFAAFLHEYLVAVGQSALDGTEPPAPDPKGFRPAA